MWRIEEGRVILNTGGQIEDIEKGKERYWSRCSSVGKSEAFAVGDFRNDPQ